MISLEKLDSIYLISDGNEDVVDITDLVTTIDIYQDIYEPFVTGNLSLVDYPSTRISKLFNEKIVGKGEQIVFNLKTKTIPVSKDNSLNFDRYFVYKVQILPMESDAEGLFKQTVIMSFCSYTMFINEFKKVKESFYDTNSNIVKQIAKNYLGIEDLIVEETKVKNLVHIPGLSPLKAINWIASRTTNDAKSKSDSKQRINNNFVFYEDINHQHRFISIGSLLSKTPVLGRKDTDGIRIETAPSETAKGQVTYKGSFAGLQHVGKSVSPLSNAKNGMYTSTCLAFDITRKKYSKTTFNYRDSFESQPHVYEKQMVNPDLDPNRVIFNKVYDSPDTVVKYYPKNSYLYSANENVLNSDVISNSVEKWLLPRLSAVESMDQEGVDVEIPGNVGLQIGDMIYFSRPQLDISNALENYLDPFFTGKFIITKIKHTLENSGGNFGFNLRTSLSLRRDSHYIPSNGE